MTVKVNEMDKSSKDLSGIVLPEVEVKTPPNEVEVSVKKGFKEVTPASYNPSNWNLLMVEGNLEATNTVTGEVFSGKIREFNEALRG
jgi:hypothetical protein